MSHIKSNAASDARLQAGVTTSRRIAHSAALTCALVTLQSTGALAASSASFAIPASTFDVAGGFATSASFQLNVCVGSEVAGTSGSASFTLDSGCGPALQFIAQPTIVLAPAVPIPTLSATASVLMIAMVVAIALCQLRRRARPATRT